METAIYILSKSGIVYLIHGNVIVHNIGKVPFVKANILTLSGTLQHVFPDKLYIWCLYIHSSIFLNHESGGCDCIPMVCVCT